MESYNKELGEKIRLVAMTLGNYGACNRFYFVGDNYPTELFSKIESWIKKTDALSIEYVIDNGFTIGKIKGGSTELLQLRAKKFLFSKAVYRCENGKVSRCKSGWWEGEFNKLYAKAVKLKNWREEIAEIKKRMSISDETKCLTKRYSA